MTIDRRTLIQAAGGGALTALFGSAHAQQAALKISHQFPGGTRDRGRLPRSPVPHASPPTSRSAATARSSAAVYPGSSLMKTNAQFSRDAQGRARHEPRSRCRMPAARCAETNIGLMPALVPSYEVGAQWKNAEVGKLLAKVLDDKGIVVVSWIWQAGGVASRAAPLVDAGGRQGHEGARRQPRDGHDAQGRRRLGDLAAVQRDLRGDADRRDGRGDDVVDQLHLVQARGDRQAPDQPAATRPTGSCSSRC